MIIELHQETLARKNGRCQSHILAQNHEKRNTHFLLVGAPLVVVLALLVLLRFRIRAWSPSTSGRNPPLLWMRGSILNSLFGFASIPVRILNLLLAKLCCWIRGRSPDASGRNRHLVWMRSSSLKCSLIFEIHQETLANTNESCQNQLLVQKHAKRITKTYLVGAPLSVAPAPLFLLRF